MTPDPLDEREFELINIIGKRLGSNQRDLSTQMDLSLGQTNMLVKRLVAKGYIRITQLNKRKVQYLLTPKGISEKFRKSVKYTLNTINSIGLINGRLQALIQDLYVNGARDFDVLGDGDLVHLVEMVSRNLLYPDMTIKKIHRVEQRRPGSVLLIATEHAPDSVEGNGHINLIEELAKAHA